MNNDTAKTKLTSFFSVKIFMKNVKLTSCKMRIVRSGEGELSPLVFKIW